MKRFAIIPCRSRCTKKHFRLLGTNGFQIEAKKERFDAACSRYHQRLKYENFTSLLADYIKKLRQEACRTCSKIIFPHSTNQIISLSRCRCHFLNSLIVHTNANTLFKRAPTLSVARGNFSEKNRNRGSKSGMSPCTRTVIM